MREALFIKKNAEKWQEYQHQPTNDPDEQAERFITILDDLSYAKTFYPQSKATKWINGIAASTYQKIYQNKKEKYNRLWQFWKTELPLAMYKYRKVLWFTFALYLLFVIIAVWSSIQDKTFVNGILGNSYVRMTEENISKGDPFGVYRDGNKFSMFAGIMFNNIMVSLMDYVGGITFGLYTFYRAMTDGMMLGAFHYIFFSHGLGWQSLMVIWCHGCIEITCMVLSATAGFVMAKGIVFPGTYSRWHSFKTHIRASLKLILAVVPMLVVAAFFESYVTYLMSNTFDNEANISIPVWAGALMLLSIMGFIVWYFVWYPVKLQKRLVLLQSDPFPQLMTT